MTCEDEKNIYVVTEMLMGGDVRVQQFLLFFSFLNSFSALSHLRSGKHATLSRP